MITKESLTLRKNEKYSCRGRGCENITQNKAKTILVGKINVYLLPQKKEFKNLGYFGNFYKLLRLNNGPFRRKIAQSVHPACRRGALVYLGSLRLRNRRSWIRIPASV
jgi:hypothetical protein